MRLARALTIAALLALIAGCTANGEDPAPDGDVPVSPVGAAICRPAGIEAAEPEPGEWAITAIRTVVAGETPRPPEVDRPFAAAVDWDSSRIDQEAAAAVIESSLGYTATGAGDGLAELDNFLAGVEEPRTHIGYAAVQKLSVTLTAGCQDHSTVTGHLTTWSDAEIGVVVCGTRYARDEAPEIALRVQKEYCA